MLELLGSLTLITTRFLENPQKIEIFSLVKGNREIMFCLL